MFLDFFFPRRSLLGEEGDWVSPSEMQSLAPHPLILEHDHLKKIGLTSVDRLIAMERYQQAPLLRRAIHLWKYRGVRALEELLCTFFCNGMREITLLPEAVFCPIPLHWIRTFDRGFNQSAQLAKALSVTCHHPTIELLKRTRSTGHQAHRSGEERRKVMREVFVARAFVPPHVILIDDVCTTGSTLESAAHALRRSGALTIEAIVLALD